MLKRVCLVALMLITGSTMTSCDIFKPRKVNDVSYSKGTHGQRIEFHRNEIKKLRAEVDKEKEMSSRSLQKHNMKAVRRSNARIAELEKKISEHKKDISAIEDKGRHLN
jgi:septal ring factor EnvC (AmiA/AmiB activator)